MNKQVAIVSDKSGYALKTTVGEYLESRDDVEVIDFGLDGARTRMNRTTARRQR